MSTAAKILDAFIALVTERGFAAVSLRDVAEKSGTGFSSLYALHRDKPSLVAGFLRRIDKEVLAGTPSQSDPEETARDRLFDVLMRRYDALKPHRIFVRAVRDAVTRDPILALSLAPALQRSAAAMLEAAGIASDGLAGAVRQNGLIGLQLAVFGTFDKDESGDLSKTMAALDGRLKSAEKWAQVFEKYASLRNSRRSREDRSATGP